MDDGVEERKSGENLTTDEDLESTPVPEKSLVRRGRRKGRQAGRSKGSTTSSSKARTTTSRATAWAHRGIRGVRIRAQTRAQTGDLGRGINPPDIRETTSLDQQDVE